MLIWLTDCVKYTTVKRKHCKSLILLETLRVSVSFKLTIIGSYVIESLKVVDIIHLNVYIICQNIYKYLLKYEDMCI